ncbi:hypothetical protein ATCC90586_006502 [Pythium insidiosum]|nr:hypothetical protein ATCC90586_006502 [Pythium insidiosum]
MSTRLRHERSTPKHLQRLLCLAVVAVQTLWAVAIPIKNVVVMPFPRVVTDSQTSSASAYNRSSPHIMSRRISGPDVFRIVTSVVNMSLSMPELRRVFESKGDFVIDDIGSHLTPEQHHIFAQYYALVFQASEFPAGGYVKRSQTLSLQRASDNVWVDVTLTCSAADSLPGLTCYAPDGEVCDPGDWIYRPFTLKLAPVDLHAATATSGWSNRISTMSFVSWTHNTMRSLFAAQNWEQVFNDVNEMKNHKLENDDSRLLFKNGHTIIDHHLYNQTKTGEWLDLGYRKFESCFGSEYLLASFYANYFALHAIQDAVLAAKLYSASRLLNRTSAAHFRAAWESIFRHDVLVTSGAGAVGLEDFQQNFLRTEMTRLTASQWALKPDRPMSGSMQMGSSLRMMNYMAWYRNSYYSFLNSTVTGDVVVADWRQFGGYFVGFNGFKFDFARGTMGVYRLAEQTSLQEVNDPSRSFELERSMARWYAQHEVSSPNGLVTLLKDVWGPDESVAVDPTTSGCPHAFLRMLAQSAWILALKRRPVLTHLAYMAISDPEEPAPWFYAQLTVNAIVGENIVGDRVRFPFNRETGTPYTGSAWVIVPILQALLSTSNASEVASALASEVDNSFFNIMSTEEGKLMLKNADHCSYGWATLNVTAKDDKDSVWAKIRPKVRATIERLVDKVPVVFGEMNAFLPIAIPHEYMTSRRPNTVYGLEGPPVFWQHTPLGVGIVKLGSRLAPTDEEVAVWQRSLTCYDTLETRFLNISTRCWSEPKNTVEEVRRVRSVGLRMLMFTMWSLGVVLNVIGAVVCIKFLLRVVRLWREDRFSDMTPLLAFNLEVQGLGMISLEGILIMAISSVPLILSYHMPRDERFLDRLSEPQHEWFAECMVLLSLTWFIRLGIELGNLAVHLHHHNWWLNLLSTRLRYGMMLLVAGVRQAFRLHGVDYNMGLAKLIVSCVVSVALGLLASVASVFFDRESKHSRDRFSRLLTRHRLSRTTHGSVAQLGGVWSQTGLAMEGWRALYASDGTVSALLSPTGDLLPLDSSDGEDEAHPSGAAGVRSRKPSPTPAMKTIGPLPAGFVGAMLTRATTARHSTSASIRDLG